MKLPISATHTRPLLLGLAGGIGSGKSAVAKAFAQIGCAVSDSDAGTRAILLEPAVRDQLMQWWGGEILNASGTVDRSKVAQIVFRDPTQRTRLESLIHPLLHHQRADLIASATRDGRPAVVIDAPLLYEVGLDRECDAVVYVDVPRPIRLARVTATRGWDDVELTRREAAQMPLDEKRRRSRFLIDNTNDQQSLIAAAQAVLDDLMRSRPRA